MILIVSVIAFLLLVSSTTYFLSSPLQLSTGRTKRKTRMTFNRNSKANSKEFFEILPDIEFERPVENDQHHPRGIISSTEESDHVYKIDKNLFLEKVKFMHRKTFPSLQPRVVRLTDHNHTSRFDAAPGLVTPDHSDGDDSSFPLPEKGLHQLRMKYMELTIKNPAKKNPPDPLSKDGCEPIASFQLGYNPTCNQIHEASSGWQQPYRLPTRGRETQDWNSTTKSIEYFGQGIGADDHHREQTRLINKGAFRHVWMVRDADGITKRAMKTLRSLKHKEKKFDLRNHDRHRRDAMAFEELHSSPLVVDLYASCSNTAIFDYADRGDLLSIFDREDMDAKTPKQLEDFKLDIMNIAYNVSLSIHDAHNFDAQGRPTMAHTDIKVDQFIYQDGYYKLSDFNRVRFITFHSETNEKCGFLVGKNGGENRAPEEYAYQNETEKVDVYSLGNVLYFLLVRKEVWDGYNFKRVYEKVKKGHRPKIPDEIYNNKGVFERYMIRAIEIAWIHNPEMRPGALQVADIIKEGIEIIAGGGLKKNFRDWV